MSLICILLYARIENFVPDSEAPQGYLGLEKLSEGGRGIGGEGNTWRNNFATIAVAPSASMRTANWAIKYGWFW